LAGLIKKPAVVPVSTQDAASTTPQPTATGCDTLQMDGNKIPKVEATKCYTIVDLPAWKKTFSNESNLSGYAGNLQSGLGITKEAAIQLINDSTTSGILDLRNLK
jgi:hypothetical protein